MTDIPSYIDWKVGDKVVCIDATWGGGPLARRGFKCPLELGKIYTLSAINPPNPKAHFHGPDAGPLVELVGVTKPHHPDVHPTKGFASARFRPVQTKKTSIEIFNRILLNPRIRISEDA